MLRHQRDRPKRFQAYAGIKMFTCVQLQISMPNPMTLRFVSRVTSDNAPHLSWDGVRSPSMLSSDFAWRARADREFCPQRRIVLKVSLETAVSNEPRRMETKTHCAYNVSRASHLSPKVIVVDRADQPLTILRLIVEGL